MYGRHQTKAEKRVDALMAEKRQLMLIKNLSEEQRRRLVQIGVVELPKAWRAVNMQREHE